MSLSKKRLTPVEFAKGQKLQRLLAVCFALAFFLSLQVALLIGFPLLLARAEGVAWGPVPAWALAVEARWTRGQMAMFVLASFAICVSALGVLRPGYLSEARRSPVWIATLGTLSVATPFAWALACAGAVRARSVPTVSAIGAAAALLLFWLLIHATLVWAREASNAKPVRGAKARVVWEAFFLAIAFAFWGARAWSPALAPQPSARLALDKALAAAMVQTRDIQAIQEAEDARLQAQWLGIANSAEDACPGLQKCSKMNQNDSIARPETTEKSGARSPSASECSETQTLGVFSCPPR